MRKSQLIELFNKLNSSDSPEDNRRIASLKSFMESEDFQLLNDDDQVSSFAFIDYLEKSLGSQDAIWMLFPHKYLVSNSETAKLFNQLEFTTFESLPTELQTSIYLATDKAQGTLFSLSTKFHDMFQQKRHATKLLWLVTNADYLKVAEMIDKNSQLMFEDVSFTFPDGHSEIISPLKYAFKVYDTYMWKLFEGKIKEKCPEKMATFDKQLQQQTEHINLEILFVAYTSYGTHYNRWMRGEINDKELDTEWLKLGKAQRDFLPAYMLREFCRKNEASWHPDAPFNDEELPMSCEVYNCDTTVEITLLPLHAGSGLGVFFVLFRGAPAMSACVMGADGGRILGWTGVDLSVLRHLYEVRTKDLVKRISQLDQPTESLSPLQAKV